MSVQQIILTVVILVLLLSLAFWMTKRKKKTSTAPLSAGGDDVNKQVYIGNLPYQVSDVAGH